jgi:hypothetical protein
LSDVNYTNILTALDEKIYLNQMNDGSLVLLQFDVRCANAKVLGIIYFLQKLLLKDSDNIEVDENELLETLQNDFQSVIIEESIEKDPLGAGVEPTWVLSEYYPTDINLDPKREGLLDISLDLE